MAERTCSEQEIAASVAQAKPLAYCFGPAWVRVESVDEASNTVGIVTAGPSHEDVHLKCQWDSKHVWAGCPSTLASKQDSLPAVGAQGVLYLSKEIVAAYRLPVRLKWPDCLPADPESAYQPLRVWPISLELRCIELRDGLRSEATIDLLDPTLSSLSQCIRLDQGELELMLSQRGFAEFPVYFPEVGGLDSAIKLIGSSTGVTSLDQAQALVEAWQQVEAWKRLLSRPSNDAKRTPARDEAARLLSSMPK